MTGQEIVEAACYEIGSLEIGKNLTPDVLTWGMKKLNRLLQTLATNGVMIPARLHENFSLVSGTASYSIKSGGDFDTSSPVLIEDAFIRISSEDYLIKIEPMREYWALDNKTVSDRPTRLYYADETIYFNYVPNSAYAFHIVSQKPFVECLVGTDFDIPDEYENFLILNLAVSFALPLTQEKPPNSLAFAAKTSENAINSKNFANQMKSVFLTI